jgi:hypothetical protein
MMEVRKEDRMSASVIHHGRGERWPDGHRAAVASLLMVPAVILWMLLLMPIGWGLQSVLGLDDTQLLTEAGAWGVAAFVAMVVLSVVPTTVGIVVGVRARRLGEHRLGTTGVVANGAVAVWLVLGPGIQVLVG